MDENNRVKLTNIIPKLSEEALNILYKTAASLLGTASGKGNPPCPYCECSHVATKYLNRYNDLFCFAYRRIPEKTGQLCRYLLEVSTINRNYTNRDVKIMGLLSI